MESVLYFFMATVMNEAYFSNIRKVICSYLLKSRMEIKIAMAWFTSNELFQSLMECLSRGIKVELVLLDDAINYNPYAPDFNDFIRQGGVLRIAKSDSGFMHHKFCVVDQELVVTGSYNWTYYAETRNMENVLVTTDRYVVDQYVAEFERIREMLEISVSCSRYSWDDLEQTQYVDYDILNYEVASIARARKLPERKVFKSKTSVEVVEKRFEPVAAYNIGMQVTVDNDHDVMYAVIAKRESLPCTKSVDFYSYRDLRSTLESKIYYGDSFHASQNQLLLERPIKELTDGRDDEVLNIKVNFTLSTDGYLHVEVRCVETGKAIDLKTTNPNLVSYDNR